MCASARQPRGPRPRTRGRPRARWAAAAGPETPEDTHPRFSHPAPAAGGAAVWARHPATLARDRPARHRKLTSSCARSPLLDGSVRVCCVGRPRQVASVSGRGRLVPSIVERVGRDRRQWPAIAPQTVDSRAHRHVSCYYDGSHCMRPTVSCIRRATPLRGGRWKQPRIAAPCLHPSVRAVRLTKSGHRFQRWAMSRTPSTSGSTSVRPRCNESRAARHTHRAARPGPAPARRSPICGRWSPARRTSGAISLARPRHTFFLGEVMGPSTRLTPCGLAGALATTLVGALQTGPSSQLQPDALARRYRIDPPGEWFASWLSLAGPRACLVKTTPVRSRESHACRTTDSVGLGCQFVSGCADFR